MAGGAGHAAGRFVGLVVKNKDLEIGRLAVADVRERNQVEQQIAVAVERDDAPVRQCQRQAQRHRRALAEIHVVEIGARGPHREPLMHGVSQVGYDQVVLARNRRQSFQTIKTLHRRVSPRNRMQIGFCQAKAELTAS